MENFIKVLDGVEMPMSQEEINAVIAQREAFASDENERQVSAVRSRRNQLLAETDWVVVFHTEKGTNIPLEWEVYRQALRDITDHVNFPHLAEDDWPVKP